MQFGRLEVCPAILPPVIWHADLNSYLIFLLAFSVALILFGAALGKLVRGSGDFFVAGRKLGPGLLFSTVLAANIGAGSTVGVAGLGYRDGLSAWWWVGSAAVGTLCLALWIGPKIWKIAASRGYYTVGDFLEGRYGSEVRVVIAALLWIGTLAILAGQLIALAWVLNVVAGVPKYAGCLIGGVVMVTYFTAGGLIGSAWVNFVQLTVLLFGFAVAFPIAVNGVGGFGPLALTSQSVGESFTNFFSGGSSGWRYLPLLAPAFIISPGLLQKVYGARDRRSIVVGVSATAVFMLVFAFVPTILGMIARINHPDLPHPELALPTIFMSDMPFFVGVIGLAALFAADVSSADAILFMFSTSFAQDLYRRYLRPDASDAALLKVARWSALGGGAIAVVLAIAASSVIDALRIFYSLLSVSLFVPVLMGLYTRRAGKVEALSAIVGGILFTAGIHQATHGVGIAGMTPTMIGLAVSFMVASVLLFVRRQPAQSEVVE